MKMIKQEFITIFRNKVLLISVIAVTFIPILYASVFSKSVWDPYGKAKDLPVAVVNEDRSAEMDGQTIDVGADVVRQLKGNDELKWEFVSASEAKKGMEDLYYYMIVTIPADFSQNATTLLNKNPEKMDITYTTNGSLNYIGEEISKIGATTLESQVRNNVTKSYVKAVDSVAKTAAKGLDQAATGAGKLAKGTAQLEKGVEQYTVGVAEVNSGANQLKSGTSQLQSGLTQYTVGVSQADNGANQLAAGTQRLAGNIEPLRSGVQRLDTGATELSDGLNQANNKLQPLRSNVSEFSTGLNRLATGSQELEEALVRVESELDSTSRATIQANLAQAKEIIGALLGNTAGLGVVSFEATQIATMLQQLTDQLSGLESRLVIDSTNLQAQIANSINGQESLEPAEKNQLIADISAAISEFEATENGRILSETAAASAAVTQVMNEAAELANQATALGELTGSLATNANSLTAGIAEVESGVNQLFKAVDFIPGAGQAEQLNVVLNRASSDFGRLSQQLPVLLGDVNQLATGSTSLANGLDEMSSQMPELATGVTQLNAGASQLSTGMRELTEKSPELMAGTDQLTGGATKLSSGVGELTQKSPQLISGVSQLDTGALQLSAGLNEATALGAKANLNEKNIEMFADPTQLSLKQYSEVANYGEALSPYIMSLALFVGCLVFNFIFPIRKVSLTGEAASSWWLSKVAIGFVVATSMALIEGTVMLIIGLNVDNIGQFYLIALISAWAYMYLVMFFAMTFDNPGRFISMILLVLQLGGAGGTFPMPLTNGFFNAIHPYLPMTYSIYGFREAISGGIGAPMFNRSVWVLMMIFVGFVLLLGISMNWLQRHHLDGVSQLDDNQKLQALEK